MNAKHNAANSFDGILIVCCLVFLIWIMWFDGVHCLDVASNVVIGWLIAGWKCWSAGFIYLMGG